MNHLGKRGVNDCASYAKPGTEWSRAFIPVLLGCGCKRDLSTTCGATCRDFNLVLDPNLIAWYCQATCKKTAAASCKASVNEFFKLWIKVPKDEDKFCADLYKGSKIMANSCN